MLGTFIGEEELSSSSGPVKNGFADLKERRDFMSCFKKGSPSFCGY